MVGGTLNSIGLGYYPAFLERFDFDVALEAAVVELELTFELELSLVLLIGNFTTLLVLLELASVVDALAAAFSQKAG